MPSLRARLLKAWARWLREAADWLDPPMKVTVPAAMPHQEE